MSRLFTVIALLAGYGLEILILQKVFDPQGDWRRSEFADIRYYGVMAALPYLAALGWFALSFGRSEREKLVFRYTRNMAVVGVVLAFVSSRQGGHASAGLLPIGFILQWVVLCIPLLSALWSRVRAWTNDKGAL